MCKTLVNIYGIIETGSNLQPGKLLQLHDSFALHYDFLAAKAMQDGLYLWNIVPKFHFTFHMCHQGSLEDLKKYWAYSGEDFVGRIVRLGQMASVGKPTHKIAPTVFARYRIGYYLRNRYS